MNADLVNTTRSKSSGLDSCSTSLMLPGGRLPCQKWITRPPKLPPRSINLPCTYGHTRRLTSHLPGSATPARRTLCTSYQNNRQPPPPKKLVVCLSRHTSLVAGYCRMRSPTIVSRLGHAILGPVPSQEHGNGAIAVPHRLATGASPPSQQPARL
jgi:hypothetical protein